MSHIKILLVEDDWIIAKELTLSLQDLGFEVLACCDTGEEAFKEAKALRPDLVLLDIGLSSEMTGIEVAGKLKELKLPFIFITALADAETIHQAKLAEPYAYLVKPVSRESLYSTIEVTLHNAFQKKEAVQAVSLALTDSVFVRSNKRLEKLRLKDIQWIEATDIYSMVHTVQGKYLLNSSLKAVEDRFPPAQFVRTHRSYIVNLEAIQAIEESDILVGNTRIPIGKTYRESLMSRISML